MPSDFSLKDRLSLVFAMDWRAWLAQAPLFSALWAYVLWSYPVPAHATAQQLLAMLYWFLPMNAAIVLIGALITGALAPRALRICGGLAPRLNARVVLRVAGLHLLWSGIAATASHVPMGVAIYGLAVVVQSLPVNSLPYWGLAIVVFIMYGSLPLVTYGLRAYWLAPRLTRILTAELVRQRFQAI